MEGLEEGQLITGRELEDGMKNLSISELCSHLLHFRRFCVSRGNRQKKSRGKLHKSIVHVVCSRVLRFSPLSFAYCSRFSRVLVPSAQVPVFGVQKRENDRKNGKCPRNYGKYFRFAMTCYDLLFFFRFMFGCVRSGISRRIKWLGRRLSAFEATSPQIITWKSTGE